MKTRTRRVDINRKTQTERRWYRLRKQNFKISKFNHSTKTSKPRHADVPL